MDYKSVLERYRYDDGQRIYDRIAAADPEDLRENQDIIRQIVLWKLNRTPWVDQNAMRELRALAALQTPQEAGVSVLAHGAIVSLLACKGLKLPMVSTILHFYYPQVFPIIDQRAYRELYGKRYPQYLTGAKTLAEIYLQYILDLCAYWEENCPELPFSQLDKVLYQLDKEKGNSVVY